MILVNECELKNVNERLATIDKALDQNAKVRLILQVSLTNLFVSILMF